ncbi:ferredoxin reductase [Mycobacterium asiaticum]|uniref:Oxidoreductase n=1 Tax=Mycobacterium asiaticum TaxID=1790 RepID=A0A1A3N306_MYCAS|nr:ferredoxin reductase [Mycobacterium asiaticum]OBK16181.1 oxidoreductase [Mycobacterium asiaticum]
MHLDEKSTLRWRIARVVNSHPETDSARTIELTVPGWSSHVAGQHIDVKLTAEDGYSAQRSYSLSKPTDGERIEITVQEITDGEVSPYLIGLDAGEEIELRGPIGGWFVWRPLGDAPVLLIGGGSGIVPLMAMLRQRVLTGTAHFRLVYSVRSPADIYYSAELNRLERDCDWFQLSMVYTRSAAPRSTRPIGRVRGADLTITPAKPGRSVLVYVCGPSGFVESVSARLIEQGHQPSAIRTERFGPT